MGGAVAAGGVIAPGGAPATAPAAAVGNGDTGGGGGLAGHFCLFRVVSAAGHMRSRQHGCYGSPEAVRAVAWDLQVQIATLQGYPER